MFQIVTDTGANLSDAMAGRLGVTVLPMAADAQSTSQVNPFLAGEKLRTLAEKGDVLCLCLSSALSGTFRSVQMAASGITGGHHIEVIDTHCACCGEGMLVQMAVRERDKGTDFNRVADMVRQTAPKICHLFLAGEPENAARSGRFEDGISAATVLTLDMSGKIVPCRRSADRKTALRAIAQMYRRTVNPSIKKICIAHGDCPEDAAYLAGQIGMHTYMTQLNDLFLCHTGQQTVSLFYVGTLRTNPPV